MPRCVPLLLQAKPVTCSAKGYLPAQSRWGLSGSCFLTHEDFLLPLSFHHNLQTFRHPPPLPSTSIYLPCAPPHGCQTRPRPPLYVCISHSVMLESRPLCAVQKRLLDTSHPRPIHRDSLASGQFPPARPLPLSLPPAPKKFLK